MMKNLKLVLAALTFVCVSCMENPLSYPRLNAEIKAFEVEGQKSVQIDAASRTVTVVLKETADISSLQVKKYE